ncbi:MAG: twitching motility protein PilT [Geobacteraceae bacterium GWC2_58_44]|nr:MAG: twitching motility protein PilT [Geobacteraceae bacterium GWC2_58_44]HBG07043.1 PIN domain nuclease [Geobacter sp.]
MKILFDTNIVLDLLLDRAPFADAAADLFAKVEEGSVVGYLCGTTVTTIHYLTTRVVGSARAKEEAGKLLSLFEVAPVNRAILESALKAGFADFEDAVIHEAACHVGAEAIVTRNLKDFKKSRVNVYHSTELAGILTVKR